VICFGCIAFVVASAAAAAIAFDSLRLPLVASSAAAILAFLRCIGFYRL
jgi:hypothetical protein